MASTDLHSRLVSGLASGLASVLAFGLTSGLASDLVSGLDSCLASGVFDLCSCTPSLVMALASLALATVVTSLKIDEMSVLSLVSHPWEVDLLRDMWWDKDLLTPLSSAEALMATISEPSGMWLDLMLGFLREVFDRASESSLGFGIRHFPISHFRI